MKKILFSLAALAALSMVAVGCKKPTDSAKELTPPVTYDVTIDGTGVQPSDYTVEPAKLTGLSGSQTITITPAAGKKLTVKKGSTAVTAGSDGKFNVQVSGATTITVDVVTDPPVTYDVTINGTGVNTTDYTVEPATLTGLKGTQTITITPTSGKTLKVQKDGSPVTAGSDGKFNVQVSGATTITVDDKTPPTAGTVTVASSGTDKNKVITVEFSEKVKDPQQDKCVITTNCTTAVSISAVAMDATDASGKKVKITLDKAMDGNVTVTLNKGFVKDMAENESEVKTGLVFTKVN